MKKIKFLFPLVLVSFLSLGQEDIQAVDEIPLDQIQPHQIKKYWLKMIENGMSQPIYIPVLIARGKNEKPILGLTAAIHGNELNGIRVIQRVFEDLDINTLNGTIIAIPGLNGISLPLHQRRYIDEEDLNRNFPGKEQGNRSQQYVWQINSKILRKIDYLVDMHTASFGRENTLYVRADLSNEKIRKMAVLQDADIILNNKGIPSTNEQMATTKTMRAQAVLKGIPAITIEYGNPQVFQNSIIERGKIGIENILDWLKITAKKIEPFVKNPTFCKKSYWIYLDQGGYLEVTVSLNQLIKKSDLIATLRNPFGGIIKNYYAPEDGVVIGKSSNPINMSGGRIIHLGIIGEPN